MLRLKKRRLLGVLGDDRISSLEDFLNRIPRDKVIDLCNYMKYSLRKAAEELFPEAKVVVDRFHVNADSTKRIYEAGRIDYRNRKVGKPGKIFLVGREKLIEDRQRKVADLLDKYPGPKGFYLAKENIRGTIPAMKPGGGE